jgi:hypothetical protein
MSGIERPSNASLDLNAPSFQPFGLQSVNNANE